MNRKRKLPAWTNPYRPAYDNTVDAFIPELWAEESLMILIDNMVAGSLVYRDFEPIIQQYGDTVNTRQPATFRAIRKTTADNVTVQDASATNVQVLLDQLVHVSFLIRDGEESKSFKDLVDEFLRPAMIAQAKFVDQVVLGQWPQFAANSAGNLNGMTGSTVKGDILGLRKVMNDNRVPFQGRNLVMNSLTESIALQLDLFIAANQVGDDGTALREASLGRRLGFDMFMDQNMAIVAAGMTARNGTISNAGGYPIGTKVFTTTGFTGAVANGGYIVIAGDNVPRRITAHTETLGNTTSITTDTGITTAVANNAVVSYSVPGAVNNAPGYAVGYNKEITISGVTVAPSVGQSVTFGTVAGTPVYTIIAVNGTTGITLDRSLEVALANSDAVNFGAAGGYNLAFHRNAIALVVRPLAPPKAGTGALSSVVNYNDMSMRAVITYDGNKQGHLVTLDMLMGVKTLNPLLGAVLLG